MEKEHVDVQKTSGRYFQQANRRSLAEHLVALACMAVAVCLIFSPFQRPACASECGASSYTPGAQGDFAMCSMPPGLYFRNNVIYTDGTLDAYPVEAGVAADLKSEVWFDLLQIVYSSKLSILGGRYFANLNIPVGIDAELRATVTAMSEGGPLTFEDQQRTTGLGDIQVVPAGILWDKGNLHFLLAENLVLNTGRYNADKLTNMGRNYFSYDTLLGCSWLDEENGHEVSFLAGYMINTKNQATGYKTGKEFHVDYTLAQYLSRVFGFGVVGYYYKQLTDDESPVLDEINGFNASYGLPTPDGYRSAAAAAGPALIFTPTIAGSDVNIIAKWLHEYYSRDRLEGDWVWLSIAVRF